MNVLIVEDEQMEAVLPEDAVRERGVVVRVAQDAIQGVMFAGRDPSPTSSSWICTSLREWTEGAGRLQASAEPTRIPVIVVSGSVGGMRAWRRNCSRWGYSGMVGKR